MADTDHATSPNQAQPLRYGIIGTGDRGCGHIRTLSLLPQAQIVALADPRARSRERALVALRDPADTRVYEHLRNEPNSSNGASHLDAGEVRFYERYEELLDDPNVDVVVISSPNHTHGEVMVKAVKSGKHLCVEKPMAHNAADAARIVRLGREFEREGRILWVGLQSRYQTMVARLRQEVEAGACGQVRMLFISEHRARFLHKPSGWNRFNRLSGGMMVEKSCHHFDLFNMLAKSKPVRVYGSGGADVNYKDEEQNGERPDILDNAFVTIDYENGVRAQLDLCMFHPPLQTHVHKFMSVTGDKGYVQGTLPHNKIVVERFDSWSTGHGEAINLNQQSSDPDAEHTPGGGHYGADLLMHQALLDCVLHGGKPETDLYTGALSVYVGVAAERSIREGRPVTIEEIESEAETAASEEFAPTLR